MNRECGKETSVYKLRAVRQVAPRSVIHCRGISSQANSKVELRSGGLDTSQAYVKAFSPSTYSSS